jgi:hypothetical protein
MHREIPCFGYAIRKTPVNVKNPPVAHAGSLRSWRTARKYRRARAGLWTIASRVGAQPLPHSGDLPGIPGMGDAGRPVPGIEWSHRNALSAAGRMGFRFGCRPPPPSGAPDLWLTPGMSPMPSASPPAGGIGVLTERRRARDADLESPGSRGLNRSGREPKSSIPRNTRFWGCVSYT